MGSATVQGELWGRQPATWSTTVEPMMRPLYEATFDALGSLDGAQLLDAGCGSGLALRCAADRGATVSGIDAAGPLVEVARQRTPDADLQTGELEELPHGDGEFDVVTAFNSIQYAVDPVRVLAELARVARPGGTVAIGVWGDPARCETDALFAQLRSLAPPPPGTPAPLAASQPGVVEGLLEGAGLEVTGAGEVDCPFTFADDDAAFTAHVSAGPLQKVVDLVGADAVRTTIHDVLEADRKPDGQLRQDNVFRYVIAAKPGGSRESGGPTS